MEQINLFLKEYPLMWLFFGIMYLVCVNLMARALWLFEFETILRQDPDLATINEFKKIRKKIDSDNTNLIINLVSVSFPIILPITILFITGLNIFKAIINILIRVPKNKE